MRIDERKQMIIETTEGNDRDYLISWIVSLQSRFENLLDELDKANKQIDIERITIKALHKQIDEMTDQLNAIEKIIS